MSILALDLGTSSVRGLVLDDRLEPVPGALARRKAVLSVDDDGTATLDAAAYRASLGQCLDELAAGGWLDGVATVAVSAQWHSIVPVGSDGEPLGPVLTWGDTRPAVLPGAVGPADEEAFHQRTGTWWHRFYWTVRVPWLRERCGSRPSGFLGLAEFVLGGLLQEMPMSVSQASGTGLLDLAALTWDDEAVAVAGLRPGEAPRLAGQDWRGTLRPEFAGRWPALRAARWTAPVGDGAASNIGTGCVDERRAAVTVGTSSAVRLVQSVAAGVALPPLPGSLWRYRVDHDRIVTGRAYSAGGNLFQWANGQLRLPRGEELEAALSAVTPGRGVRADPRLGGDRPPGTAPAGSGVLSGIGLATTAVDLLAALMDGVCRMVADDLTVLESTVGAPVEVVLGGGAVAASPWWRGAFQAALAPRSVSYVSNPEVGAIGAALLASGRSADVGRTDDATSPTSAVRSRPLHRS
ncbi:MAG TPA: FGGY family carbohydrate kinase [Catenuloplanes sp.]|jgi:gluconokinase